MQNRTDIYSRVVARKLVPEKKSLLDEMEDLEKNRAAKKDAAKSEKAKKEKSDLDLDGIW